jgi:hypothetical protein
MSQSPEKHAETKGPQGPWHEQSMAMYMPRNFCHVVPRLTEKTESDPKAFGKGNEKCKVKQNQQA